MHEWLLLAILVLTLGVLPIIRLLILISIWIIPMKLATHQKMREVIDSFSRWCMLDVFGLALFLVATEGKELVKTKVLSGLYIVVIAIGLSYLLAAMAILISRALTTLRPSDEVI